MSIWFITVFVALPVVHQHMFWFRTETKSYMMRFFFFFFLTSNCPKWLQRGVILGASGESVEHNRKTVHAWRWAPKGLTYAAAYRVLKNCKSLFQMRPHVVPIDQYTYEVVFSRLFLWSDSSSGPANCIIRKEEDQWDTSLSNSCTKQYGFLQMRHSTPLARYPFRIFELSKLCPFLSDLSTNHHICWNKKKNGDKKGKAPGYCQGIFWRN